jgi:hypothetical protein
MKPFIAVAVVAIALAFLLIWRTQLITRGTYQIGFFVGLSAFVWFLLLPRSTSFMIGLGRSSFAPLSAIPFVLIALTPFVLLVESGIAGYRGFSSWLRYACLMLAALGGVGLVASLILPRLLRQ